MAEAYRSYTRRQKRGRGLLVLRGIKQAAADCVDPSIEDRIDKIDAKAEEAWDREAGKAARQLDMAKDDVAGAKVALKAARNGDVPARRRALKEAERDLERAKGAARKYGIR